MSLQRWRRARGSQSVMRTDDEVAPRTTRRASGRILAAGLVIMVIALTLLIAALQRQADHAADTAALTRDEVAQVRSFLAQRDDQRDTEREDVQAQLDAQARVLCLTIADLRSRARSAETRTALDRALTSLKCTRVVHPTAKRSPLAPSSSSRPPTRTSPRATASPSRTTRTAWSAPRPTTQPTTDPTRQPPTVRPAPSTTTTTSDPGLVCGLLPLIC